MFILHMNYIYIYIYMLISMYVQTTHFGEERRLSTPLHPTRGLLFSFFFFALEPRVE